MLHLRLLTTLSVALLAGCGGAETVRLTAADDGRAIDVDRGATLVLRLDANPSTGFAWQLVERPDAAVVRLLGVRFEPAKGADRPAVGRGGTEAWRFEAVAPGTTSFRLVYVRRWEPADSKGDIGLTVRVGG